MKYKVQQTNNREAVTVEADKVETPDGCLVFKKNAGDSDVGDLMEEVARFASGCWSYYSLEK